MRGFASQRETTAHETHAPETDFVNAATLSRRKSEARTRPRNWSGVSGGVLVGGVAAGFGFTTTDAAAFVAFFAVSRAASRASC
jgi:predicted lipid-binding transport protein (Tim44 family)